MACSLPVFFVLLLVGFLSVNFLFAFGYALCGPHALSTVDMPEFSSRIIQCFFFSVQTIATIGYGQMTPVSLAANVLVTFEVMVGLLGLAMATGLLFSRFSRPTARVVFSNRILHVVHDGVPSLVFRMANERLNQIVEAQVRVSLLRDETTPEGEFYRNFYDLELERQSTPVFAMSWTVVHPITKASPIHGMDLETFGNIRAEFIVSMSGTDDVFAQTIYARHVYATEDVAWGRRFVDIIHRTGENRYRFHLDKISDLTPDAPGAD